MGDTDKDDVVLVEESPTQYDANRLPRTIEAGRFTGVVTQTHTIRTQVVKGLRNMDKSIAQLIKLENEGEDDSDGEEFINGLYKEISSENNKVKSKLEQHEDLTSQIRTMCGFIINSDSTLPNVQKVKADASAALAQAEKAEESLEKRVTEWGNLNLRWLKGKKKKKKEKSDTVAETGEKVGLKSNWLASFEKQLQPKGTLKARCRFLRSLCSLG